MTLRERGVRGGVRHLRLGDWFIYLVGVLELLGGLGLLLPRLVGLAAAALAAMMAGAVISATGAQGAPVASALTAAGEPVVGLTRNPDAAVPGAQVAAVDYSSAADLTELYRDAAGMFVHLPVTAEEVRRAYARNIVAAVRAARPARVVFSTSGYALGSGDDDDDDPARGAVVTLFRGLHLRHERAGSSEDLNGAITIAEEAAASTAVDHPGYPARLTQLSYTLYTRFVRSPRG